MAGNVYVTEFSQVFVDVGGNVQMAFAPPIAKQIVASGATSNPFNTATRFIRCSADSGFTSPAAAQIEIGRGTPSITSSSMRLAINQTEYFKVNAGDAITVGTVAQ